MTDNANIFPPNGEHKFFALMQIFDDTDKDFALTDVIIAKNEEDLKKMINTRKEFWAKDQYRTKVEFALEINRYVELGA